MAEAARILVPKLPVALLRQAETFAMTVYGRSRCEAVVLLHVNPGCGEWQITVPFQVVRGRHVEYDPNTAETPPEFILFGSIHSRVPRSAFRSDTAPRGAHNWEGLHIAIENLDAPVRSYTAEWTIAGYTFPSDLVDVIAGEAPEAFDARWLNQVLEAPGKIPLQAALLGSGHGRDEFLSPGEYAQYLHDLRSEIDDELSELEE